MSRSTTRAIRDYMRTHGVKYQQARAAVLAPNVSLPSRAYPPLWPVATDPVKVRETTPEWAVGCGEQGLVTFPMDRYPRLAVFGGEGSGRTTFVTAAMEQHRAGGAQVFIFDGSGGDLARYEGLPNIASVSTDGAGHVRVMSRLARLMSDRREYGSNLSARGVSRAAIEATFHPVIVVLHDFHAVSLAVDKFYFDNEPPRTSELGWKYDFGLVNKVGRQMHVYLLISDDTRHQLPSDVNSLVSVFCHLGPSTAKFQAAFYSDNAEPVLRELNDAMFTDRVPGRGVAVEDTVDGIRARPFQGFFSYSPVFHEDMPTSAVAPWTEFREQVSDKVVPLSTDVDHAATDALQLPEIAYPPLWPVAMTRENATADEHSWNLGIDAHGDTVWFLLMIYAHALLIGGTGSGTTVASYAIIESLRASGSELWLSDGKGLDFSPFDGANNVTRIAHGAEGVSELITAASDELRRREDHVGNAAKLGTNISLTPLVIVISELDIVLRELTSDDPSHARAVMRELGILLRVGRSLRVHLLATSKGATSVLGELRELFPLQVRYGQNAAREHSYGTGLVSYGAGDEIEFRGFYSYSPAAPMDAEGLSDETKQKWTEFRDAVSDVIPDLYRVVE